MADPNISGAAQTSAAPKPSGGGCLRIFVLGIILFGAALFGGLQSVKFYTVNCQGMLISDCLLLKDIEVTPTGAIQNTIVMATGPYTYNGHSVSITANIPLQGGPVTGNVTGECNGKLTGTYDGKDNGIITGNITGYCEITIIPVPAKATYSGKVIKDKKNVPISFEGSGAGFTHNGSLSLSY